ncbi:uncharacterized protein PAC_20199 [Phialocephala subalpina]|uniref:Rhodopsin domain-containing protein n=1 Tax=Phialocephala subalpina TaxID=576137 RepID=A0A1L7XZ35_9HELO|nr:uncharacterized protein PAC_20199 [Phialocephala subalpina]
MKGVDLHLEDYMIFGALFFLYATLVTVVIGKSRPLNKFPSRADPSVAVVDGGYGHHMVDLTPGQIQFTLKLTLLTQFWFAAGVGLVKCSICQMLARIFSVVPSFGIAAYTIMGICVGWAVMTCLIGLLICQPIAMNWDPTIPGGHCGKENIAFAIVGVVDLATDLAILILPLPEIKGLQIPLANKIALLCIFGLGTLTMAISAVRMSGIFTIDFADFTFTATPTSIWSVTEIGTAIVVASSPIIRPLFDKVFHSIVSSRQSNRYTFNNSNTTTLRLSTKASGFDRLGGDEAPLNDIERQGGVATITSDPAGVFANSR